MNFRRVGVKRDSRGLRTLDDIRTQVRYANATPLRRGSLVGN